MIHILHRNLQRALPPWLYQRLIGDWDRNGFKKYLHNTGWMFVGRVVTFAISFFTIVFVARYLGPENLGKLSYAQSFLAIFSMFASLGIDQIVYRDLIAHPEREGEILGTAVTTKVSFGILTALVTVAVAFFVNDEPLLTWLIGLMALSLILQPLGVIVHVFNARVLSKYTALATMLIAVIIPLLKLLVVWFDQGILYFASIIAIEALLYSAIHWWLYATVLHGSVRSWSVSRQTFVHLVRDSWPLMLVGVTGYIYVRIDQVMIQHFIDSRAVGLYEAAVRLTEPLGFIPGLIIGSLFPALIHARRSDRAEYRRRFRSLVALCIGISVLLASTLWIAAPYLINWLYGNAFIESVSLLRIYVWSNVGTVATILMYNYFIAEHRTYLQLVYTGLGAVLNIALNILFIPHWGAAGAAYATLLTVTAIVTAFLVSQRTMQWSREKHGGGE